MLGIAIVAGAPWADASRLAASMVLLQFSIGATNDLVDAPRDRDRVPPKPIPTGLVGRAPARATAIATGASGLGLAASFGVPTLVIAVAGLACGLAYDLRLSRTAFSWIALAVALPLVPVFAWFGATGGLPASMTPIVPLAMLAGAGLAIGNALIDLDGDRSLGRRTVAVALGRHRAWAAHAVTLVVVVALLVMLGPVGGGAGTDSATAARALTVLGVVSIAGGVLLLGAARSTAARAGWAFEAIGVAALGVAWVMAATASA